MITKEIVDKGYKTLRWLRYVTVCIIIMSIFPLSALSLHNLKFRQFSTSDNLPNSFVCQVCQDSTGYIWIATKYGLYRYDGYDVKAFKNDVLHPHFLPSNNITSVACGPNGQLWIGTIRGLCRLSTEKESITLYTLPDVERQRVNRIFISRSGKVLVGGIRGLFEYDEKGDSMKHISLPKAGGPINIQTIFEDDRGDFLLGTWAHGLIRYVPNENKTTHYDNLPAVRGVLSICQTPWGKTLLGTRDGLVEVAFDSAGTIKDLKTISSDETVYALAYSKKENKIYLGRRNGLFVLDKDYRLEPAGINAMVRNIYTDNNGLLWLSTQGEGIFIQNSSSDFFETSFSRRIQSVYVEPSGRKWVALDNGLFCDGRDLFPNQNTINITQRRDTLQVFVSSQSEGFWVADMGGSLVKHFTSHNTKYVSTRRINKVYEDSHGNWWTGGHDGIGVRYADGRESSFDDLKESVKELGAEIIDILEDKDGSLWMLTTSKGVVHLTGNMQQPVNIRATVYNVKNGRMPVDTPICIYRDNEGNIWLGTEGANLCLFDRNNDCFKTVQHIYHLPGDMVSSIEQDQYGQLWIGTNRGLARLTTAGSKKGKLRIYTTEDGLPDNFFEPRASYQRNGIFYFGTGNGLACFKPVQDSNERSMHNAVVTGIRIDGQEVRDMKDTILVIPTLSKSFTLSFASLVFQGQHQCTYIYRLKGFDRDWHTATADNRNATYSNLPPGNYTFELKATDDDGNWSPTFTLPIEVEPPFWRTWWAYAIYIMCIATFAYLIVREVRRRIMTRNRLRLQIDDKGQSQVVVTHMMDEKTKENKESPENISEEKKQLAFEIKDVNFTNADEEFLRQAVACVNLNLSNADFTIPQMINEMGTSRTTLFKKLKALTGMNASGFIADIRLKTACRIIDEQRGHNIRISDLAYSVGFNDPKYFSVSFKKKFGVSPSEYIEQASNMNG